MLQGISNLSIISVFEKELDRQIPVTHFEILQSLLWEALSKEYKCTTQVGRFYGTPLKLVATKSHTNMHLPFRHEDLVRTCVRVPTRRLTLVLQNVAILRKSLPCHACKNTTSDDPDSTHPQLEPPPRALHCLGFCLLPSTITIVSR